MDIVLEYKPHYRELLGLAGSVPEGFEIQSELGVQLNSIIDELNRIGGQSNPPESFERFRMALNGEWMNKDIYQANLNRLWNFLYGKYYSLEPEPFSGPANAPITLSQHNLQNQIFNVQQNFISTIDSKVPFYESDSSEGKFLKKLKVVLENAKDIGEIVGIVLRTAKEFGLSLTETGRIFS